MNKFYIRDQDEQHTQPNEHGKGFRWFFAYLAIVVICVTSAALSAKAQTLTFTPSVTSGNGQIETSLTWSTQPAASSCTASGHPSWTGSKPANGTAQLPVITMSGTYQLELACTFPGDTTARLTWTNPTKNTDGSAFTDPKLVRIKYGAAPDNLNQTRDVPLASGALPTTYTFTGLGPGVRHYGVVAVNARDVESELSNVVSKTISGSVSRTETVRLTVNPKPAQATSLAVE